MFSMLWCKVLSIENEYITRLEINQDKVFVKSMY